MDKELICKEYEMLHGEIEKKIELQNNLLIFMVTATATIITIAVERKNLLLYLFPFLQIDFKWNKRFWTNTTLIAFR